MQDFTLSDEIKQKIKEIIPSYGSKKDYCDYIGCTSKTLNRWLRDEHPVKFVDYWRILESLGMVRTHWPVDADHAGIPSLDINEVRLSNGRLMTSREREIIDDILCSVGTLEFDENLSPENMLKLLNVEQHRLAERTEKIINLMVSRKDQRDLFED